MEKLFRLRENSTNIRTEIVGGLTTFLMMVYIIVVNPAILSAAGVPFDQMFMVTVISAVIGTLYMAFFANYPIAIAPGILKLVSGKGKEVHWILYVFGIIFVLQMIFFPAH